MPDPGDTKAGDTGQGSGWSKSTPSPSTSSPGGFSGGTLNGGNNNSGSNWGGSSRAPSGGSNLGAGGQVGSGPRGPENSWGTRGSPTGGALSGSQLGGGGSNIGGALSAGLGGNYTVSNPVSATNAASTGYYHSFTPSLPGQNTPTQFDRTIRPSNMVNMYGTPMETWSNRYNPNVLTAGAQKLHQAVVDASLRRNQPVDFFSGLRGYNPKTGTKQHSAGQALDVRINDPVTGLPVGYDRIGNRAYNPIGELVNGIREDIPAMAAPYRNFAADVIGSFSNNPGVYGDMNNQRWGGAFETGRYAKDYMHFDEGKIASGVSADQQNLRREAALTTMPMGPLSNPNISSPIQLAMSAPPAPTSQPVAPSSAPRLMMAGMGGFTPSTVTQDPPTAYGGQYTNIMDKGDLQPPSVANTVPGWQQSTYTGPQAVANVPSWQQSSYTGLQAVANTVPSWQQSSYTGPAISAPPSEPPSQVGENIPFPVDRKAPGVKAWGSTVSTFGNLVFPGLGSLANYAVKKDLDQLEKRWPSMTNAERQAVIDKWSGRSNSGYQNVVYGGGGGLQSDGGDGPQRPPQPETAPNTRKPSGNPSKDSVSTAWKQDAIAYGFTADQLKDPDTAAYIKQLWEIGWIPKSVPA